MTKSKSVIFFGTEDFSLVSLQALLDSGFEVALVISKPDSYRGRQRALTKPPVVALAEKHAIPVMQPLKLNEEFIHSLQPYLPACGVLVSYGKIIPARLLAMFSPGIVNVHPSLLPKYRGPSPIEAAILNGDKETGVSIMQLTPGMDEGPVYKQKKLVLSGTETKPVLSKSLAELGSQMLVETLPEIVNGSIKSELQKNNAVSYTSLLSKEDGFIDPTTETAEMIERKVRAYLSFPKSRLTIRGIDVFITSSKIVENDSSGSLVLQCAQNTLLEITQLIAPSGKAMSGNEYLRGYS